jgi:hypothetical protein
MANRWRENKLYLAKETETETEMGMEECLRLVGHKSYQPICGGPDLWSPAALWKLNRRRLSIIISDAMGECYDLGARISPADL